MTTDVIVGFPNEDEAAFERTLELVDGSRHQPRARLLLLAPPGHGRRGARRPGRAGGEEAPLAGDAGPLGGALAPPPHGASSAGSERVLVDKVADTQCSGYTADYTRCYLPAGAARAGASWWR